MGILRKSPYEGRSAAELYGQKPPSKIVADQCKNNAKQQRDKKKK